MDRVFLEGEKREKRRGKAKRRRKFLNRSSISAKPEWGSCFTASRLLPPSFAHFFIIRESPSACHVRGRLTFWIQPVQGACDRHSYIQPRYTKGIVCDELATVIYVHVPRPSRHDEVW